MLGVCGTDLYSQKLDKWLPATNFRLAQFEAPEQYNFSVKSIAETLLTIENNCTEAIGGFTQVAELNITAVRVTQPQRL